MPGNRGSNVRPRNPSSPRVIIPTKPRPPPLGTTFNADTNSGRLFLYATMAFLALHFFDCFSCRFREAVFYSHAWTLLENSFRLTGDENELREFLEAKLSEIREAEDSQTWITGIDHRFCELWKRTRYFLWYKPAGPSFASESNYTRDRGSKGDFERLWDALIRDMESLDEGRDSGIKTFFQRLQTNFSGEHFERMPSRSTLQHQDAHRPQLQLQVQNSFQAGKRTLT